MRKSQCAETNTGLPQAWYTRKSQGAKTRAIGRTQYGIRAKAKKRRLQGMPNTGLPQAWHGPIQDYHKQAETKAWDKNEGRGARTSGYEQT